MKSEDAVSLVEKALYNMGTAIREVVFNEWILVSVSSKKLAVNKYKGPRQEEFFSNFKEDISPLLEKIDFKNPIIGDFDFSYHGYGNGFDAYMCIGEKTFILFNNTKKNTDQIQASLRWKAARVHLMKLQEKFIEDPVT